jgi:beta-fructofuranosidase
VEGRILYTSVVAADIERGRVRAAWPERGSGDWSRWAPGGVVLPAPDDPAVVVFRDPFVVREGARWRMLVGAGLADGTGCALGYVSDDLASWEPTGVVAARHTGDSDPVWTGSIWECPQVVRVDGVDVLVLSCADADGPGDVVAAVGTFDSGRFVVGSWQRLTAGAPYAASVFTDREGRPGLLAWLRGVAGDGWAGAVSAPMVLTVTDGRAGLEVHPAVAVRRRTWDPAAPAWDVEWEPRAEGDELALVARSGRRVALLRAAPGTLTVDVDGRRLALDHDGGRARVLRDGPVLEVSTSRGLAAAPVTTEPLRPEGRGWQGWALA